MSSRLIAERYAHAFGAAVQDDDELERGQEALQDFASFLAGQHELRRVLVGAAVALNVRKNVFDEILEHFEGPNSARRLLQTLFARNRIDVLNEVVAAIAKVVDDRLNRTRAELTVANPLSDVQAQSIQGSLQAYCGKSVSIITTIDPEILGGVVAKVDGTVIDGSLRSRLQRVRAALLTEEN